MIKMLQNVGNTIFHKLISFVYITGFIIFFIFNCRILPPLVLCLSISIDLFEVFSSFSILPVVPNWCPLDFMYRRSIILCECTLLLLLLRDRHSIILQVQRLWYIVPISSAQLNLNVQNLVAISVTLDYLRISSFPIWPRDSSQHSSLDS